ncbi:recombination-related endonuclease [Synechococcus phage B3]|nr:recombination-related endonuclease [Synechococcus phage B3]QGT54906.1 recombination-related endonuclease [Synechococcus phage B23]
MIIFKKVKAKNFLSIGDHFIEYDLNSDNLTLFRGKNSHGKSLFTDILTFTLFKKAYRSINLPQLINNVNKKDCLAEVEFTINKNEWMIRRGLTPTIFEIYKNGQLLDQHSSVIEQQKWLEQNVLKMNYKTFTQIIVLGTTNFVPFMQLPPSDRREIIEELLDIKVFSSMNMLVKDNLKTFKDEVKLLKVKEVGLEEKIDLQKDFIEQIQQKESANLQDKKDKIERYIKLIRQLNVEIEEHNVEISKIREEILDYSKATTQIKKLGALKGKISQKLLTIREQNNFFNEHDVCPTCSQEITDGVKQEKLKETQEKIDEIQSGYDELLQTIKAEEKKEKKFIELSSKITELNQKIYTCQSKINQYTNLISEIQNEISSLGQVQDIQKEQTKLEGFMEDLYAIKNSIITHKEQSQYYEFVNNILKDGGVKTVIINKYLPLINRKINEYLKMLDLYVNFTLDGEFNESILTPTFENFSYGNFSEGQKQRINLALTFGLMSVAAIKNSVNTNLLILDEILDGSMDAEGISLFLAIIRKEMKSKNIFMISHRDNIDDKFDVVINFKKIGHFTSKERIN